MMFVFSLPCSREPGTNVSGERQNVGGFERMIDVGRRTGMMARQGSGTGMMWESNQSLPHRLRLVGNLSKARSLACTKGDLFSVVLCNLQLYY